ncbi:hypothetical protein BDF20DRAFT_329643 [Mycotypha africana]|uniref:uncharacterized protein n=1 Tax=Mycotypha africana TaxID=64632 RepID=UPI002300C69C|nr:uncharacterized protein BDF20DRAFT_329643 [Mycotypha africana]KAI8988397.1 hypothetical protein BDF20DRAFT_329643 [Mycotypha africana]
MSWMSTVLTRISLLKNHLRTFTMRASIMATTEKATFAAGCFWGVEHIYKKHFGQYGIKTKVGYTGGNTVNPKYREVCSGGTHHAEALEIDFDPQKVPYEALVEFFYKMHDPTTINAQGPDVGTQYRSAIFYHSPEQRAIAEEVTKDVQEKHYKGKKIITQIVPADVFYDAETYHQMYLEKNPNGYECPTHYLRW